MHALVLTGVEMRELAPFEESLSGPTRRGSIEEQGSRSGHRYAGGTLADPWEGEYSLGETTADALISGLLVDLLVGQPRRRRRAQSRSDR
jgi:hypothetical protein